MAQISVRMTDSPSTSVTKESIYHRTVLVLSGHIAFKLVYSHFLLSIIAKHFQNLLVCQVSTCPLQYFRSNVSPITLAIVSTELQITIVFNRLKSNRYSALVYDRYSYEYIDIPNHCYLFRCTLVFRTHCKACSKCAAISGNEFMCVR